MALVGLAGMGLVARHAWLPRLAYADRHLLVYLDSGPPQRVPIEVVEGFLLGQGPTMLPGKQYEHAEATNARHSAGRIGHRLGRPRNQARPGPLVRRLHHPARHLVRTAFGRPGATAQPAAVRSDTGRTTPAAGQQPGSER